MDIKTKALMNLYNICYKSLIANNGANTDQLKEYVYYCHDVIEDNHDLSFEEWKKNKLLFPLKDLSSSIENPIVKEFSDKLTEIYK